MARLQTLNVPCELRCHRRRDAGRDDHAVERFRKICQSFGDNSLGLTSSERIPPLSFANQMSRADASVVEAAIDSEREIAFDPAFLKEIRDGIVYVGERASPGQMQYGQILRVGIVIADQYRECEPAQQIRDRPPFPLEGTKNLGKPVGTRSVGAAGSIGVLKLRVLIDPVEPERLGSVLLMNQRDRLTIDDPVVPLDDKVLADTPADEFRAIMCQPELHSQRVPVMLTRETVRPCRQPRLENMGGVSTASRQVPITVEARQQQLRLIPREHRPALIVGT